MRADSIGTIVNAQMTETSTANVIVRPKLRRNLPTMPLMKDTGKNTAINDKLVAKTAGPISFVAASAAGNAPRPSRR